MKTMMVLLLAAVMLLSLVTVASAEEPLSGGWETAEDTAITEERSELFFNALGNLVGVDYTPVAYLGSQVVAGTNHCFLCLKRIVVPDAIPSYVLVYVYQDLQGNAEILNIADFDFGSFCTYGAE